MLSNLRSSFTGTLPQLKKLRKPGCSSSNFEVAMDEAEVAIEGFCIKYSCPDTDFDDSVDSDEETMSYVEFDGRIDTSLNVSVPLSVITSIVD
jgi:hypothetical protein